MSRPTPSKQSKSSESNNEFHPGDFDNKSTPSSGLKLTQHGEDYQLLLLCLCLWRVLKNKISDFLLATELPEAEKFDDVVIKYKLKDKLVLRLLQAKHKEAPRLTNSTDKITLADLLTPNGSKEFSLLKYFRSSVKIQEKHDQNPAPAFLVGGNIQDFILTTNIDIAEDLAEQFFEVDDENSLEDDFLFRVPTKLTKKLKIKESDNELTRQLEALLYTCSDFDELVEKLADCLLFQQRFDGTSWIFKEYYYPLVKHVLEFEEGQKQESKYYAKLSDNFKGANSQCTNEVKDFREALIKEIAFRMSDYKINILSTTGDSAQNSNPQSDTNRKRKPSADDSQLTKELKEFVGHLKIAMYPAKSNPPNKTGLTPALCKDKNLFEKVVDDKKGKLCDDFVKNSKKLSPKAKLLRKMLIDEVVNENMAKKAFDTVSGGRFPTTDGYATRFQPKSNPEIKDIEVFAKEIGNLIDKCADHTIEITDVVGTEQFRKNIIEVAGHVIVKVSSWFEFSGNFIRDHRGRSLAKGLIKFRDTLRKRLGKEKFDTIDRYSLNIKLKGFTSCEEATLHRSLPSKVTEQSINDFYENFRLIVNYPNRKGLRKLIETEVKAKYQNLNSKAFVDSFVQEVYQWMTHRLGTFYTPKKVEELLARLDENLSCYELDGMNQSFYMALPTKYKFECEDLMTLIKDFLQRTHSSVLLLRVENLTLCRVRFMQAFWSLQEKNQDANGKLPFYLHRFGYLFMTTDQLSDESFCEKIGRRNIDKDQWNLRVVECSAGNLPETKKFKSILNLLLESSVSSSVGRKVIFIVKEDMSGKLKSALDSYFTQGRNTNFRFSTFDLKTTFSQLEVSSRDELLKNGRIKLHGRNRQLGEIVNQDTGDLTDETTLANLIADRDDDAGLVCIGSITQQFQDTYDPDYYMMRHIKQVVINIDPCKIPAEAEGGSYYLPKTEEEKGTDLIIVADSRVKFKARLMNSQKYSVPNSIHWVQEVKVPWIGKRWIWRDSIGSISRLSKYRKEEPKVYPFTQREFLEFEKDRKIVILHGVPGAGKSKLLGNFFIMMADSSQPLWKIYINLNLYTDFFNKKRNEVRSRIDKTMSSLECSEFLLELLQSNEDSKLETQFEMNLLRSAFQITGKIQLVLFLDGFDEISPNYKDIVLDFLLSMKDSSGTLRIFITTRPSFRMYLEENLKTFSFEMRNLTENEQDQLLRSLIKKLNVQMEVMEVVSLMKHFCRHSPENMGSSRVYRKKGWARSAQAQDEEVFSAIPLHVVMFAEVCAKSDRERIRNCIKNRDLSRLYEMYLEIKYQLYREEKMRVNPTNVSSMEDSEYAYDGFLKKHKMLALWMLFSRQRIRQFVDSFEEYEKQVLSLLEDIKAGKFKYGIVFGVSGEVPQFTHRTFAEYLVARFFIREIASGGKVKPGFFNFIIDQISNESVSVFRTFCDGMMREIGWNQGHLEDVPPLSIANGLVESYNDDEWGIFSFLAQIFKRCCPLDISARRPDAASYLSLETRTLGDSVEDESCDYIMVRISNDDSWKSLWNHDSSAQTGTWDDAFSRLLDICLSNRKYFLLFGFLLKWRPGSVRRSYQGSSILNVLRTHRGLCWEEKCQSNSDFDVTWYVCTQFEYEVGPSKSFISKFVPNWLVRNEDFSISVLYEEDPSDAGCSNTRFRDSFNGGAPLQVYSEDLEDLEDLPKFVQSEHSNYSKSDSKSGSWPHMYVCSLHTMQCPGEIPRKESPPLTHPKDPDSEKPPWPALNIGSRCGTILCDENSDAQDLRLLYSLDRFSSCDS
ncbi:unnamed protein product [Hermetia illucens]|uniref:NACHT domain-containing protein n=1 Tax=Hermetia illucens TaxID=343691 RepID=A0A7R8UT93_HERIL|nr:unnamed protein product [Hermetia illucens]